jgi:hypothetical protein
MNNSSNYDKVIERQRGIFVANMAALVVFAGSILASVASIL